MYCTNCGKEIKDDAKFCPYCGKEVLVRPRSSTTHTVSGTAKTGRKSGKTYAKGGQIQLQVKEQAEAAEFLLL